MHRKMVLDDVRRALTYLLIEERPSSIDEDLIRAEIEAFLRQVAVQYEPKELVKWLNPEEKALGKFFEHLRSRGKAEQFKVLWH